MRDKIAQGKLDKWLSEVCLLDQPYVRDSDRTVDDLRTEIAAKTGENVEIKRFTRFEAGPESSCEPGRRSRSIRLR